MLVSELFLDDEASTEESDPREFYDIAIGATVYHLTSGSEDIEVNGIVYRAEAMERGPLELVQLGGGSEQALTMKLRVDHPIVRRWFKQGIPPKSATVVAWRLQVRSGVVERFWTGDIASIDCEEKASETTLTIASLFGPPFRRRLPTLTVGRQCSHVLYGPGCNVSRAASNADGIPFLCTATVMYMTAREVRLDLSNVPADYFLRSNWLQFGELKHVASGERMTIADQADLNPGISTVTQVTLQMQIVDMKFGDAIEVYAGCAHEVITCQVKFANQVNYGGFPALPTKNPFFPTGLGVMEQT